MQQNVFTPAALRKHRSMTQVELASRLRITQSGIVAMEKRSDPQWSSLERYVRALGGRLEMHAVFDEETVRVELPRSKERS